MRELPLELPETQRPLNARITLRIKIGDHVSPGDVIADIETDKASAEMDAPEAFTLCGIRRTARGMVLIIED